LRRDIERFSRRFQSYGRLRRAWDYYWSPQYRTLLYFRLCRLIRLPGLRTLFYILYRHLSVRCGVELGCAIGGGVIMPHWGQIKLNAKVIGDDLYVLHNVTVGDDYSTGMPTIGNNVFIGAGSMVVGGIHIGDNVVIGAMSLVNSDVPSNTMVAGSPAQVIRKIDADTIHQMTSY